MRTSEINKPFKKIVSFNSLIIIIYLLTNALYKDSQSLINSTLFILKCFSGITIIFFIPGNLIVLGSQKFKEITLFEYIAISIPINIIFLIVSTTIIKFIGYSISNSILINLIILSTIICSIVLKKIINEKKIINDLHKIKKILIIGSVIICLVLFFSYKSLATDILSLKDFLPIDNIINWSTQDLEAKEISIEYDKTWEKFGDRHLTSIGNASIKYYNDNNKTVELNIIFFINTNKKTTLHLYFNNIQIKEIPIPKYMTMGPGEYKILNDSFIKETISLSPGTNTLRFITNKKETNNENFRLTLFDYSNLNKKEFLTKTKKEFLFVEPGYIFDFTEILNIASNLRSKIFPYITNPWEMPTNTYSLSEMPLSHYINMFILVLIDNNLKSLNFALFPELILLLLVTCMIIKVGKKNFDEKYLILIVLIVISHFISMKEFLRPSTIFPDTIFTVFLLLAFYFLIKNNNKWFLVFACLTILTRKSGLFLIPIMIIGWFLFSKEKRKESVVLFLIIITIIVFIYSSLFIIAKTANIQDEFKKVIAQEYFERFNNPNQGLSFGLNKEVISRRAFDLTKKIWDYSLIFPFIMSFISLFNKKDSVPKLSMFIIGSYFIIIIMQIHQRNHYFIPVIYLLSVASIRTLANIKNKITRNTIFFIGTIVSLLALIKNIAYLNII